MKGGSASRVDFECDAVGDSDGPAVQFDQTVGLESVEGSGDDFADGSDARSDLLVCQHQVEMDGFAILTAADSGFAGDPSGEALIDLLEGERLDQFGASSESAGEQPCGGEGDLRVSQADGSDVAFFDEEKDRILLSRHIRRIGLVVEGGQFRDVVPARSS